MAYEGTAQAFVDALNFRTFPELGYKRVGSEWVFQWPNTTPYNAAFPRITYPVFHDIGG